MQSLPVVLVTAVPDHVGQDAEESQLLVVTGQAFVLWVVQLARPVIVQDVPKNVRIPVKEVLLCGLVEEELPLVRPEQCVRIFFQRISPRLEPSSAHINQQLFVVGLATILGYGGRRQRVGGNRYPSYSRRSGKGKPSGDRRHGKTMGRNFRSLAPTARDRQFSALGRSPPCPEDE